MAFRFIHTSDWQIGKVFRFVDEKTMGLLQEARLQSITRIGEIAKEHGIGHVLVAGDVYDAPSLAPRSIAQPLERMRNFPDVVWHLLPGNHDPHRPNGLWDRILSKGLPDNVKVYTEPKPVSIDDNVILLPAPLQHRSSLQGPTAYMDEVPCDPNTVRIGVAHGTVTGFGSDPKNTPNYVAPNRPETANLDYLALGDWHGQKKINDRCWYSGTHETDAFDVDGGGEILIVEVFGGRNLPSVTSVRSGVYQWKKLSGRVSSQGDVDHLEEEIRELDPDLSKLLVQLSLEGALSLEDRQYFDDQIAGDVSAALCHLRANTEQLFPKPTPEDMDRIDRAGFVRVAAEELKQLAEQGNEIAAESLQRLYLEHMKLQEEEG